MRSVAGRTGLIVFIVALLLAWGVTVLLDHSVHQAVARRVEHGILEWLQGRQGEGVIGRVSALEYLSQFDGDLDPWKVTQLSFYDVRGTLQSIWSLSTARLDRAQWYDVMVEGQRLRVAIESPFLETYEFVQEILWVFLLAVVVLVTAAVVGVVHLQTRSLRSLAEAASHLVEGHFDRHIEIAGPSEVQRMASIIEEIRVRFRQLVGGAITQAMVWEGDLELYPLSMLLMMLKYTGQTGVLVIMSKSELGRIYVRGGDIRGAAFKDYRGLRAFYALFLLSEGAFKFNPKMKPLEDELQTLSWHAILLYAARRVHTLQFIEQYIPSFRHIAKRVASGHDAETVRADLTPDELRLWDLMDDRQTVRQYATALRWTPERVQRYLYRFAVLGLIETNISLIGRNGPPQNVVSLWARAAWRRGEGGV